MTNSHATPLVPGPAHAGPMCLRAVAGEATRDIGDIQGFNHKESLVQTPPVRPFLLPTISKITMQNRQLVGLACRQTDRQTGNAMQCDVM